MSNQNFSVTPEVGQSPVEDFAAVYDVRSHCSNARVGYINGSLY